MEHFDEVQEENHKLGAEGINTTKVLISRKHFKLDGLEDLTNLINGGFTVKRYTLDSNFNESSSVKALGIRPTVEASQAFPSRSREMSPIVIAGRYVIGEEIASNKNYYPNKDKIKGTIEETAETKPGLAAEYSFNCYMFQKFDGKCMKFFPEDKLPKLSIYDALYTFKDAGKFGEIDDANYSTYLNSI